MLASAYVGIEPQRGRAHRLAQRLGSEVRRPDRIGVVDHGRPSRLVARHRHRQGEGEEQPDQRQERGLHHSERLAQRLRVVAQGAAGEESDRGRAEEDSHEHERQLPAVER